MRSSYFLETAEQVFDACRASRRFKSLALLAGILLYLASEKIPFTRDAYGPLPDGGYYMNIAQHVRDGDGLVSDLSLAHKGAPFLPHPTDMYPLWPLVYGYISRAFPIEPTGHWLPMLLYFAALGIGFSWAGGLFKEDFFPESLPGFHAGHLFVVMLGYNGEFFRYTSYPYTEGLTYFVVVAGLWRMTSLWSRPSWLTGFELGVWLGLATLCRKQLFIMTMAAGPVLLGAIAFARGGRAAYGKMAVAAAAGFAATAGLHYGYMAEILPEMTPGKFLRWDQNQHTTVLTPLRTLRPAKSVGAYLRDRLGGVPIAFGTAANSYTAQYYTFQYAIPIAILPAAVAAFSRLKKGIAAAFLGIFQPHALSYTYVTVFALGGLLSIHAMHMYPDASGEWMFGGRHALTSIFLILLANVLLFRTMRFPWAPVATFLLATSIYLGGARINEWEKTQIGDENPRPSAFTEWANREKAARGKLTLALRQPQTLAHFTPGVGYHWYGDYTPFKDICAMTARLGVDYVVVLKNVKWKNSSAFKDSYRLAEQIGGAGIYEPVPAGACAPQ